MSDTDLRDTWLAFCDRLAGAADVVLDPERPGDAVDRAEGFRHVLRVLHQTIGNSIEAGDAQHPELAWVHPFKAGQDNPDGIYQAAAVDLRNTYRLTGDPGTVHYLGLTLMTFNCGTADVRQLLTLNGDELPLDDDGNLDLVFSPDPAPDGHPPGTWHTVDPITCRLMIRQFFNDWEHEEPAHLHIECLDIEPHQPRMDADRLDRALRELATQAVDMTGFWSDFGRRHLDRGQVNSFSHMRPDQGPNLAMGASTEQDYGQCWWHVEPGQALVYEVEVPDCHYWGVQLGDVWFQSLDWVYHQSSLNGHQAVIDPDGVFRAVICGHDPGVANWLDTAGATQGCITYRWNRADRAPVPKLRLVDADQVDGLLPDVTTRLTPAQRADTLYRRRRGALGRFLR